MRSTRLLVTLGTAGLLAFAGCGGGDKTETTDRPAQSATGDGKSIFASTCGGCHTLEDAGTGGKIGPNLDDRKPSKDEVLSAIKRGPSSMPENLLAGDDATAVAENGSSVAGS
jgi:mono/diheme cytochrome c family protein